MFIRDFFIYMNKNKSAQVCLSVACIATYFMTDKNNIPTLKYNDFEISADFIRSLILLLGIFYFLFLIIHSSYEMVTFFVESRKNIKDKEDILNILKNAPYQEKLFFFFRLYGNGDEVYIDINHDSFFYESNGYVLKLKNFKNELEKGIFIRSLEKKGLLEDTGNQTMRILSLVWEVLKENPEIIFKQQ